MNEPSKSVALRTAFAVILFNILPLAEGTGFYISEVGTPGSLGTASVANVTNTSSADAAWTNPAGMTGVKEDTILGGMQFILPKMEFDSSVATSGGGDGGNAGDPVVVPSFFYVNKLSDDLRFGFSVAGTMGAGVDYGENFVGRYSTSKAELGTVSLSPSLGYRVYDRLSLGGGVSFVYTRFDQDIMIDPAVVPGGTSNGQDGKLKIVDATDWGYQPFLSMTYQLTDRAMLGMVYRAEMDAELDGDVKVRNLNLPVSADSIDVEWDNPQTFEVGLKYQLDDKNTLFLNAGWQEWSAFSENTLAFSGDVLNPVATLDRDFDDTWHAGIAFAHNEGNHVTTIGFSYNSSPVDDKHRTLDLPFDETFKLSMAYAWKGSKHLDFALGGTVYLVGDAKINQTSPGAPGVATTVIGEFETNTIFILGGTARYEF